MPEPHASAPQEKSLGYTIEPYRHSRDWAIYDPARELVCLTVYKRGAVEVVRRLETARR